MRVHPCPGDDVQRWVRSLLRPTVAVSQWIPDIPPANLVVATTTVTQRSYPGWLETWLVALESYATARQPALDSLVTVISAAQSLADEPATFTTTSSGEALSWALTYGAASGPDWISAEPVDSGLTDHASAFLTLTARFYT